MSRKDIGDPMHSSSRPAVKRKRMKSPCGKSEAATTSAKSPNEQDENGLAKRPLKKQRTAPSAPLYADEEVMEDAAGAERPTYAPNNESNATEDSQGEKIASSQAHEGDGTTEKDIEGNDSNKTSKLEASAKPKNVYTVEEVKAFRTVSRVLKNGLPRPLRLSSPSSSTGLTPTAFPFTTMV
jgi:hypothetical protein